MSAQVVELPAAMPSIAVRPRVAFWLVAATFAIAMAFSTVPTPLWALYRQRDHFSTMMVTVAFAVYGAGVVISLFLAGHVSDWLGRRRVLVSAILVEIGAAIIFLTWPDLPGLVLARFATGLGIGMVTATATAYLAELHALARPGTPGTHAGLVSTAANLGGLALGPLVAGLLAQYVQAQLTVPYLIFLLLLVAAAAGLSFVPETVDVHQQRRAYRPQRVAVPPEGRVRYFALAGGVFGLFAILGLFTSLAPSFLAAIGQSTPIVAGLAAFLVFGAAAVGQVVAGRRPAPHQLAIGFALTALGLVILATGVLISSPAVFLVGGLIAGAGAGILLKGSLATAVALSTADVRGEAIAGIFTAGYIGLAVPVLGIGLATGFGIPLRTALVAFAVVILAVLTTVRTTLRHASA